MARRPVFFNSTGGYGPYAYNITPDNTALVRNAWLGSSNISIALQGDSTVRGVDEGASPYNTQYSVNAMPVRLAVKLNALGVNATADNWYGLSGTNFNDYMIRDSRLTSGGTAAQGSAAIQGGASMSMSSATATMTYTNVEPCDTAEIYTLDSSSFTGATLSWSVDGGSTTNIVQAGNNTIRRTVIPLGSVGIHTITISWVSGANALYGIECYNSTKKQVRIRNWGISGGVASDFVNNTGTPTAGRIAQMNAYPPKLLISECGLINSQRNSTPVATVKASMQSLIDATKAAGSNFIFLTPPFDNSGMGNAANQEQYVKAMYELADANNVGIIDIRRAHVTYNNAVTYGWMRATDAAHPSQAGYDHEADIISQILFRILL
jgi:hypothetical protein